VIKAFSTLYGLGNSVAVEADDNAYACAAMGEGEGAVLVTHYNDDDETPSELFKVEMDGFMGGNGVRAEVFVVDENSNLTFVKEEYFTAEKYSILLKTDLFTTYLIKLYKL
jgi:hypothetical protein